MSGLSLNEGGCSQEIENSSSSTRNSLLKINYAKCMKVSGQNASEQGARDIVGNARFPRLPPMGKRDYIENWILSNEEYFSKNLPETSEPGSPVLGKRQAKRIPGSPILDNTVKRARFRNDAAKENLNCRFNKNSDESRNIRDPRERQIFKRIHDDPDSTIVSTNSKIGRGSEGLRKLSIRSSPPTEVIPKNTPPSSPLIGLRTCVTGKKIERLHGGRSNDISSCRFAWASEKSEIRKFLESPEKPIWNTKNESKRISKVNTGPVVIEDTDTEEDPRKKPGEDSNPIDRSGTISRIVSSGGERRFAESPLIWDGYENRESSKSAEIFSTSSPLIKNSRRDLISDDRSTASSRKSFIECQKLQRMPDGNSPLRWNGYQSEIRDGSELPDDPALSSPMNEVERIIESSSTGDSPNYLALDDRSSIISRNSSYERRKKNCHDRQPETPSRWNGYESLKSSRLSSPLIGAEPPLVFSSSGSSDRPMFPKIELSDDSASKDTCLRVTKGPIKLETLFDSKNHQDPISKSSISSGTRISIRALEDDTKIENEFESESSVSDSIESILTQNPKSSKSRRNSIVVPESNSPEQKPLIKDEYDSDETYCSGGDPVEHLPTEIMRSQKKSQRNSQLTIKDRDLCRNKSEHISQASSPLKNNNERPNYHPNFNLAKNPRSRTKRAKKGSLLAKLRSLLSTRLSHLQIWQYQMSRSDFKNPQGLFVELAIRERETRYGRYYLLANIIRDSKNLLKNLFPPENDDSEKNRTVTLMIVPEISGARKIQRNGIILIYPPWEIMDQNARILSIVYFEVSEKMQESIDMDGQLVESKRVLEKFHCPCLQRGEIDESCPVKFTNTRPSVMKEIFR